MTRQIIFILCLIILIFSHYSCGQEKKALFDSIKNNSDYTWTLLHDSSNQTVDSIITFRSGEVISTGQPIYTITTKAEKRKTDSLTEVRKREKFPNPFAPATTFLPYTLMEKSLFRIAIYDTLGNEVANLINMELPFGEYLVNFSIYSVLKPNTYLLEIKYSDFTRVRKLIIK